MQTTQSTTSLKSQAVLSISSDLTIYVELTGNDTTGDGTVEFPFATPHKALNWLSKRQISDATVTIQIGAGEFIFTETIEVDHSDAHNVKIKGAGLSGVKPSGSWYVPLDGAYPGIGATDKFLTTAIPTDFSSTKTTDAAVNISLIKDRFSTILTFNGCTGFLIDSTYLNEIDGLAIIGDATGSTSGINVGQTVFGGVHNPKAGGFNLGPSKHDCTVAISNFGSAGVSIETGFSSLANAVIGNCQSAIRVVNNGFAHVEECEVYNSGYGFNNQRGGQTSDLTVHMYGCYIGLYLYGSDNGYFSPRSSVGNKIVMSINDAKILFLPQTNGNIRANTDALTIGNSEMTIYQSASFTDIAGFGTWDIGPDTTSNDAEVFFRNTTQTQVDAMNWVNPLNLMMTNGCYVRGIDGLVKHEVNNIIDTPTTLYVELAGNDTTGDGSIGLPYATPQRAMEYLSTKSITADITIQIGIGEFIMTEPLVIEHPNADKVSIFGAGTLGGLGAVTEVHYTPRDGVHNPLDKKWLVSSQGLNDASSSYLADWTENKATLRREYLTILNFPDMDGIVIRNTSLKSLDLIALLGNYPDAPKATMGVKIGKDGTWDAGKLLPKNGSVTFGTTKEVSTVCIAGFQGGVVQEGASIELGPAVFVNCYTGISAKSGYIHQSGSVMVRCTNGIYYDSAVTTTWGRLNIYGTRSAVAVYQGCVLDIAIEAVGNHHIIVSDPYSVVDLELYYTTGWKSYDNATLVNTGWTQISEITLGVRVASGFAQTTIDDIVNDWSLTKRSKVSLQTYNDPDKLIETAPWTIPLNVLQESGSYIHSLSSSLADVKDFIPKPEAETSLATYTPDFNISDYFEYTITEDTQILDCINLLKGQTGQIIVKQDATGSWNVNFDAIYEFTDGNPLLNDTANGVNVFEYRVINSESVLMEFVASYNESILLQANAAGDLLLSNDFDVTLAQL